MVGYLRLRLRARKFRSRIEPDEVAWLLRTLKPGDTAIDVGAYKGSFAYWMARAVGPTGSVHAFEPQPGLAAGIASALRWGRLRWAHAHAIGVSDHEGEMTLHAETRGRSAVASFVPGVLAGRTREFRVPVTTIDRFVRDRAIPRVALLKCDAEGHELEVFRGARETLARDRPALLFECEARFAGPERVRQVLAFVREFGYDGEVIGRLGGSMPLREFDLARDQSRELGRYLNNFALTANA